MSLLQCQLTEGAVSDKETRVEGAENGVGVNRNADDEIEEGELPDCHGEINY